MSRLDPGQQKRHVEVVGLLIAKGADPRTEEMSPMAVSGGFRETVFGYRDALELMIKSVPAGPERQAFIDERGIMNGYTRLIDAALNGQTNVVDLLLEHGADTKIKGYNGRTAETRMTSNPVLLKLNQDTFLAEAGQPVDGEDWDRFLWRVLADDFVLVRSNRAILPQDKRAMITHIRYTSRQPPGVSDEKVCEDGVYATVTSIVTLDTGKRYHNIKVFLRQAPDGQEWQCMYWRVVELAS